MQTRALGQQGLTVSMLGLGCMGMSEFYGPLDDAESVATIHRAIDLGITFFDTADMYGPFTNERLVGRALRDRRAGVVIATKFGNVRGEDGAFLGLNGSPDYVRASCDASLERLGVDYIDLYYQHRVDPKVEIEETVGAMAELIKGGKVRWLGLSEVSAATLKRAASVHPISALQSEYSLWSREIEAEVIPACRELGVTIVAYSPLARGLLTGHIRRESDLASDDFRRTVPRFQGENLVKNLALVRELEAIATEKNATTSQLALAWVTAQGEDVVALPGTKRRSYLQENLRAEEVRLDATDLARLEALGEPAGARYDEAALRQTNA